ncbi:hypothetical protein HUJ04_001339, partial [Dendroctonus ponderosae]
YPEGVEVIGFADDLAVVAQSGNSDELLHKTNRAVQMVATWMQQKRLELAPEKTELLVLNGKRDRSMITIAVSGKEIKPSKTVKYLGINIRQNAYMGFHVQITTSKAEQRLSTLTRVMQNVGGPSSEKRLLLYGVVQSIVLYGAHVWGGIVSMQKYKTMLGKLQRRALLRVISGYRTVSTEAVQVLAGIPPIHLLELERIRLSTRPERNAQARRTERDITINEWQKEWESSSEKGSWTKKLIKNLSSWVNCQHKKTDYYVTQALSGHGSFKAYTKKIGKTDDICMYCHDIDTAEHTVFICERWENYRNTAILQLGHALTKENLIETMIESEEASNVVHDMLRKIMTAKEDEERIAQVQQKKAGKVLIPPPT